MTHEQIVTARLALTNRIQACRENSAHAGDYWDREVICAERAHVALGQLAVERAGGWRMNDQSVTTEINKINTANMTAEEQAVYAMRALKKIQAYAEFYMRLDTGAELSANLVRDVKSRLRYMRHRLDVIREAA